MNSSAISIISFSLADLRASAPMPGRMKLTYSQQWRCYISLTNSTLGAPYLFKFTIPSIRLDIFSFVIKQLQTPLVYTIEYTCGHSLISKDLYLMGPPRTNKDSFFVILIKYNSATLLKFWKFFIVNFSNLIPQ